MKPPPSLKWPRQEEVVSSAAAGRGASAAQGAGRDSPRRHPVAAAWAASLVIHLGILLVAALVTVGGGHAGGARAGDPETIDVAVLTEAELGQLLDTALDADAPSISDVLDEPLPIDVDLSVAATMADLDQPLHVGEAGTQLTAGLGAGDLSDGALGGAGGAASFFGVEAQGTRFAYIVDISGSMSVGIGRSHITRLDVLKRELHNSVASLGEESRFLIVLFDHVTEPLGGKKEWTHATDTGKAWARRQIAQIEARGGTIPVPAFREVFAVRPRPDAIYFMTDGEFDTDAPRQIALMNADLRIPIHAICFDSREGEELMKRIAADSGGTYTFVPGVR